MDSEIQLTTFNAPGPLQEPAQAEPGGSEAFSLPPVDRGKDAFLFLLGAFTIEALVWGFPFSFGLFQEYYSQHEPFASDASGIAIIGTSATGVMYISGLFVMPMYKRWPALRRPSAYVGLPIMATALALASFANTVWQLILTQGILYGIGGLFLYWPTLIFLDEWFVQRKGLAFGVMWAGTGAAGVCIPLIMNVGLEKYGFRTMLRVWSITVVVLMLPLLSFVKPRLPPSTSGLQRRFDLRFVLSPIFLVLQLCNIVQSLGYFIPGIYLPTVGLSLGASSTESALTVILVNCAGVFGSMAVGALIDRVHVTTCVLSISLGASMACFFLWGFSQSLPMLLVFSAFYGLTAGAFTTCWPGVLTEVKKRYTGADTGITFGLLGMGRGIGAIASGPLSEALLSASGTAGDSKFLYGSQYSGLVIFTGVTAALGGTGFLWLRYGRL